MTDAERHRILLELFNQAVELDPPERGDFIAGLDCDEDLRAEIAGLLKSFDESEGLLEQPVARLAENNEQHGREFGSYRIVREIGRGGMGAVFLAERREGDIRHRVAIKILRQTIRESEIERRFLDERQILATLQHPNIAAFVDGGVSETGEPFIAMEFIDGVPITEYCRDRGASVRERLRIFLKACKAVGYAHRNLVVHRDIKPSNILVNSEGEPKLLDFGLAKLVGFQENDVTKTLFRALTPAYASPEQLKGDAITTSSDIYSLGVCLYEILTGRRPVETDDMSFEEIIRSVLEDEPFLPSRIVSSGQDRSIFVGSRIGSDLDNIVLMALRKEPERRYSSVDQFIKDIEHYLDGQPVMARSNTFFYRTGKLIARNRAASFMIFALTVSLIAGLVTAVHQYRRALAEQIHSQNETARAQRIARFMEKVLNYANPAWYAEGRDKNGDARLFEVIEALSDKIETEFPDDPRTQAELHHKFAEIHQMRHSTEKSLYHATRAYEIGRVEFGEKSAATAKYLYYLGAANFLNDRQNLAFDQLEKALAIFGEVDPKNPNVPYLAEDLAGYYLSGDHNPERARELLTLAYPTFAERDGEKHFNAIRVLMKFAHLYAVEGNREESLAAIAEAKKRAAESGGATTVAVLYREEFTALGALGDPEGLRSRADEIFDASIRNAPPEDDAAAGLLERITAELAMNGLPDEAVRMLEIREKSMMDSESGIGRKFSVEILLAIYHAQLGNRKKALGHLKLAVDYSLSIPHKRDWALDFMIARTYYFLGDYHEARTRLERARESIQTNLRPAHPIRSQLEEMLADIERRSE